MRGDTMLDLMQLGELRSYRPSWPAPDAAHIDQAVCDDAECDGCGRVGMTFQPYRSKAGSYRAFAVCPFCGYAMEF
jgi:hypothetical protein